MEYKIKTKLEAGEFYELTNDMKVGSYELQKGQIVKITEAFDNYVKFMEFYKIPSSNKLGKCSHSFAIDLNDEEREQFEFFLQSILRVHAPVLIEKNIPRDIWTKELLLDYISFLEDNEQELDIPKSVEKDDITEMINFLDNLGDGDEDLLGMQCKKYSDRLRQLLTFM